MKCFGCAIERGKVEGGSGRKPWCLGGLRKGKNTEESTEDVSFGQRHMPGIDISDVLKKKGFLAGADPKKKKGKGGKTKRFHSGKGF